MQNDCCEQCAGRGSGVGHALHRFRLLGSCRPAPTVWGDRARCWSSPAQAAQPLMPVPTRRWAVQTAVRQRQPTALSVRSIGRHDPGAGPAAQRAVARRWRLPRSPTAKCVARPTPDAPHRAAFRRRSAEIAGVHAAVQLCTPAR